MTNLWMFVGDVVAPHTGNSSSCMREVTSYKLKVYRKQFTVAAQPAAGMQYPSCDMQSPSCVLSVEKRFTILTE